MSIKTLRSELKQHNQRLDSYSRSHWGIGVQSYKVIKALTQLVGAGAGVYAMQQGADPLAAFFLIALIISGPEAFEMVVSNQE
jgi:hypothetical protein